MHEQITYDLFVIYSYHDAKWVADELATRLDSWGISYAIDFNDCLPGRTIASETIRLGRLSRRSLVVLSKSWNSLLGAEESTQRISRLVSSVHQFPAIILRIDDTPVPGELRHCMVISVNHAGDNAAWMELRRAVLQYATQRGRYPLDGHLKVSRVRSDEAVVGYGYIADVTVANQRNMDIMFDGVRIDFSTRGTEPAIDKRIASITLCKSAEGVYGHYSYGTSQDRSTMPAWAARGGIELSATVLRAFTAITTAGIHFRTAPYSVPGACATFATLSLTVGDVSISDPCWCALPPLLRTPFVETGQQCILACVSERFLPSPSHSLETTVVAAAFATARKRLRAPVLNDIGSDSFTTHTFGKTTFRHSCGSWSFTFYDRATETFWRSYAEDPYWIAPAPDVPGRRAGSLDLTEEALGYCRIDCRDAYLMACAAGAVPVEQSGDLHLEAGLVGRSRPIWRLPVLFNGERAGITADTGELVIRIDGLWAMAPKAVWNL